MLAAHRESHDDVLADVPAGGTARRPDAIAVAAGRTAAHLLPAARLAANLGAELLVLCSPGRTRPEDAAALVEQVRRLRVTPLYVPAGFTHPSLAFATSERPDAGVERLGVLGVKRNVALLLGRMLGWRTMLFLDDDIEDLSVGEVLRAARALHRRDAVGLKVSDFPDNSVVCHANRLGGRQQKVFVGGSALLVDPTRPPGFYPSVYNEDWLFLYPALLQRTVSRLGTVHQLHYDPFEPGRAAVEEFGEVIAEGLMDALHRGTTAPSPGREAFWAEFLESRQLFVDRVRRLLTRADGPVDAALRSLDEADRQRRSIDPATCAAYHHDWLDDLARWHDTLTRLPHEPTIGAAAERLGLDSTVSDLVP